MSQKSISRRTFLQMTALSLAVIPFDWGEMNALAATVKPKNGDSVVIIGAGLGGLCCGAYLAKAGIPVTLVEQHFIPGGYATSFQRGSGKFTFEVSLEGTSIHDNTAERMLRELGVLDKIQLVPIPEVLKIKGPGFEIAVPQKDPRTLIALLSRQFPQEKEGIRAVIEAMVGVVEETDRLDENKGVFSDFPSEYPRLWNVHDKTLAEFLDGFVTNPDLKNALSEQWGYYGLPPSKLSGFYYAVAFGEYLLKGSYYIKPRSQALSSALADAIKASGGRIEYGVETQKILVENGTVTGVVTSQGKTLPALAVVSNASAITTLKQMTPPGVLPPEYLKKLDGYRPSISTFIVWLGLHQELRGKLEGYDHSVSSGMGPEADYELALAGEVEKMSFGMVCYDNIYEGYSRPGTSTLKIICLSGYEPWRRFEADYRAGRKDEYRKEKNRWADTLIARAEKEIIPGLRSMIEVKEAATPLTNWRFTRNPEGAIYGFEQAMNNTFMNRIDNRTPLKGLYLSGAWGSPGGGYTAVMGSGRTTFAYLMEDFKAGRLG